MKIVLKICLLIFCVIAISCKNEKEQLAKENIKSDKKPNILIIYPDQLRRYSAGFWSEDKYKKHVIGKPDPVVTPNMDKLAKNGVVFTQAISNFPLCSPARGMLLSGMYPEQNGIWNNCRKDRKDKLKDEIPTITDLFYDAGYNTSYFGKCHWLNNDPLFDNKGNYVGTIEEPGGHYLNKYDTYIPPGKSRHSIEYFYQSVKDAHVDPLVFSNIPNTIEGKKDGELHQPKIFTPKNEAQKIVEYLQNKNSERDNNKPFCMIWSLNPPHNPWNDKNTDMEMLKKHYDTDKFPKIDSTLVVRKNADLKIAKYARHYFANVTSVDKYIGIVIEELKKQNQLDNTIIILSSDHGELLGSHGKKGKNIIEMEAMAVPFTIHWPKGIKAGTINNTLLSVPDVLPTSMGLAGLKNNIPNEVEGIDFSKNITKPSSNYKNKPESILLLLSNSRGILTDRYTLCITGGKKPFEAFIYDNVNDPYQLNKISFNEKPKIATQLLKQLGEKLIATNDPWYKKRRYKKIIPYTKTQ
ncbi:arylsulfatase A-like enzyme [Lutibacter sp. Hel_I_33_5]|uniref:sulfatase family protein n=1 Tax=Lutibacter sp. Hel_I_33_5 TaxID=1566289 RepID=UPI0011AA3838|nr:sulfatase [Lutibacter sp. Hel_I_33_5]TVZ55659.1 arylsulfatase A-like enzyme [Lutibacter sp. Hel_I_33_5]